MILDQTVLVALIGALAFGYLARRIWGRNGNCTRCANHCRKHK